MRVPVLVLAVLLLSPLAPAAPVDVAQDDAGSGRDAPATSGAALVVLPGVAYDGNLTTPLGESLTGDGIDYYAFEAGVEAQIEIAATTATTGCLDLFGPDRRIRGQSCPNTGSEERFRTVADVPGRWTMRYVAATAQAYRFSLGIDAPAPRLGGAQPAPPPPSATPPHDPGDGAPDHLAVIAVIDDGINPYQVAFRDDSARAKMHPSTYIPGFPADAEALPLTFGLDSLYDSVAADCAVWEGVQQGKLYWIPGTRIVGAISLPYRDILSGAHLSARTTCADPVPKPYNSIVGTGGHGTMTASRAAGNGYGACPDCLIVIVQGFGTPQVAWAADQPWIDVQTNSWGPVAPGHSPVDARLLVSDPSLARAVEEAAARQPSFWASGNGALFRWGFLGHPTQLAPHLGPSAIRVGGHDSGNVTLWPGSSPHVVSDSEWSWAASHGLNGVAGDRIGGGTSGATPFAAGVAARILRNARADLGDVATGVRDGGVLAEGAPVGTGALADGVLTKDELLRVLLTTADARPDRIPQDGARDTFPWYGSIPLSWSEVPGALPAAYFIGYGAVTPQTGNDALAVLRGDAPAPDRTVEDAYFAADAAFRTAAYQAYAKGV